MAGWAPPYSLLIPGVWWCAQVAAHHVAFGPSRRDLEARVAQGLHAKSVQAHEVFQNKDPADTGTVTAIDLALCLKELRVGLSDKELQAFFDLRHIQEGAQVEYAAFLDDMARCYSERAHPAETPSKHETKPLSPPEAETQRALAALSPEERETAFAAMDHNHDGVVDKQEWLAAHLPGGEMDRLRSMGQAKLLAQGVERYGVDLAYSGVSPQEALRSDARDSLGMAERRQRRVEEDLQESRFTTSIQEADLERSWKAEERLKCID